MPSRFSDLPMALDCPSEPGRVGAIDQMALSMEKSTITYKCLCCLAPVYHQTSFTVGEPLAHLSCRKETKNYLSLMCVHQRFHKVQITVVCSLKFHWYLRTFKFRRLGAKWKFSCLCAVHYFNVKSYQTQQYFTTVCGTL